MTIAPVALYAALAEVAQWLPAMAAQASVALHVEPCDTSVHADSRRLRQIVVNLRGNAIN